MNEGEILIGKRGKEAAEGWGQNFGEKHSPKME